MDSKRLQGVKRVAYCTRMTLRVAAAFCLLAASMGLGLTHAEAGEAGPAGAPRLTLAPCQIEHPARLTVISAECGYLEVPENPAAPDGRHIRLYVARVPAINRRKSPDPLFLIAGGPGGSAVAMYASASHAFERVHRERDVVLLDQRGTGQSNPLNCQMDEDVLMSATDEIVAAETQRCLTELQTRANVSLYTTSIAVQDLDHVRAALGYDVINLYGASYGTRVAQHYVRRFPKRVRSVVLDGVVPPQLALGPALAIDAEKALLAILSRCKAEPACHRRFGDPTSTYRELRTTLQTQPVTVSLPDPTTGEPQNVEFSTLHLATVLRLAIYTSDQAALLPLALDRAQKSGDYVPLAGQFLMMSHAYEDMLAYGMHNTVVCAEDVPFYPPADRIDRVALEKTFLGAEQLDALRSLCEVWPRGPSDPDLHTPLDTEVPVLLLSGGNDPVTPPAYAEQARKGMKNSLHVVLKDLGHGQIVAPCVDEILARFLARASVKGLDASCTRQARAMPFFTTLAGPQP
jgi:pimeloyl-ACP methyl ester carboxylesterase